MAAGSNFASPVLYQLSYTAEAVGGLEPPTPGLNI